MVHRLARLVGEHAALGDHRQVMRLDDAGVDLDAIRPRHHRADLGAPARGQALRLRRAGGQPRGAQRRDDGAVARHRTELCLAFMFGADQQLGLATRAPAGQRQQVEQGGLLLRHVHGQDRRGLGGDLRPQAEPGQVLHRALRQRQGAGVGRHVVFGRQGVVDRDLQLRQAALRLQREHQPDRTGADDGQPLGLGGFRNRFCG